MHGPNIWNFEYLFLSRAGLTQSIWAAKTSKPLCLADSFHLDILKSFNFIQHIFHISSTKWKVSIVCATTQLPTICNNIFHYKMDKHSKSYFLCFSSKYVRFEQSMYCFSNEFDLPGFFDGSSAWMSILCPFILFFKPLRTAAGSLQDCSSSIITKFTYICLNYWLQQLGPMIVSLIDITTWNNNMSNFAWMSM